MRRGRRRAGRGTPTRARAAGVAGWSCSSTSSSSSRSPRWPSGCTRTPASSTSLLVLELYLAIWLVWVSFMLYGNVAGERTHRRAMIVAMGCIAVMAASIPGVRAVPRAARPVPGVRRSPTSSRGSSRCNVWRTTVPGDGRLADRPDLGRPVAVDRLGVRATATARYWLWARGAARWTSGSPSCADDRDRILRMIRATATTTARQKRERTARRRRERAADPTGVGADRGHRRTSPTWTSGSASS